MKIRRGIGRLLATLNFSYIPELVLPNGRRADMVAIGPKGEVWIIEIKSSVQDFRSDNKWQDYKPFCDRLYFGIPTDVLASIFPTNAGLIVADDFGAEVLRHDEDDKIIASTRKSLLLNVARAASSRLASCTDPDHSEKAVF